MSTDEKVSSTVLPSTTTIIDTMVATTMCKTIGNSVGGGLSAKNVGYLILLSSIPDIKKMILDSITFVKNYILTNFKQFMSKLTHTHLYLLVKTIWKYTFGLLFRAKNYKSKCEVVEEFVPVQPLFTDEVIFNFGNNLAIIEQLIKLCDQERMNMQKKDIVMINNKRYQYSEILSGLRYRIDEIDIHLINNLEIRYEQCEERLEMIECNENIFSLSEDTLVNSLNLKLKLKPTEPKSFADLLDNRIIAAFLEDPRYIQFRSKMHHIGMIHYRSWNFSSIYNFTFTSGSDIEKLVFEIERKLFKCELKEQQLLIMVDLLFVVWILTDNKAKRQLKYESNILKIDDIALFKSKLNIHSGEYANMRYWGMIGKMDCLTVRGEPKAEWSKIEYVFNSLKTFYQKNEDETVPRKYELKFELSTLNPEINLCKWFITNFLPKLLTNVDAPIVTDKVTVYSVKVETVEKKEEVSNPEYERYCEKKSEIMSLAEDNPEQKEKLLQSWAKVLMPPIKMTEVKTCNSVVCKKENTICKPFDTLYLREKDQIDLTHILKNFKDSKQLYQQLGLKRKMGLMLYGDPGTGKSTTIMAIATYLNYDIYYVSVSNIRTNAQFKMLIDHLNEQIPKGGIIVMEDIDAQSTVFHRRNESETMDESVIGMCERGEDLLDLSYILNILDGTLSHDNTVFIFTTNYIEKIDSAVYRPGRVDAMIHLKKCDHFQITRIFHRIMEREIDSELLAQIEEDAWTPADVIFHIVKYKYRTDLSDTEIMSRFIKS